MEDTTRYGSASFRIDLVRVVLILAVMMVVMVMLMAMMVFMLMVLMIVMVLMFMLIIVVILVAVVMGMPVMVLLFLMTVLMMVMMMLFFLFILIVVIFQRGKIQGFAVLDDIEHEIGLHIVPGGGDDPGVRMGFRDQLAAFFHPVGSQQLGTAEDHGGSALYLIQEELAEVRP